MATTSEIHSLDEINYRSPSKLKTLLVIVLALMLMMIGFLNYYPIGEELKKFVRTQVQGSGCSPEFQDISLNPLFGKLVIDEVSLPASCFNRGGPAIKLSHLTINYHLINLFPLGLPFRVDTEVAGQPLSVHYVAGFGEQLIRIKDQKIALGKIMPLIAPAVKLAGDLTTDLTLITTYEGVLQSLSLKAASKNFEVPSQSIQGFNLPNLNIGELFLEARSENPPRIVIEKLIAGNPNSPIRANFKGWVSLQEGNPALSPMELKGEIAFSKQMLETLPLLELLMQPFPQKDGFYQVKLGGVLGAPKGSAP